MEGRRVTGWRKGEKEETMKNSTEGEINRWKTRERDLGKEGKVVER